MLNWETTYTSDFFTSWFQVPPVGFNLCLTISQWTVLHVKKIDNLFFSCRKKIIKNKKKIFFSFSNSDFRFALYIIKLLYNLEKKFCQYKKYLFLYMRWVGMWNGKKLYVFFKHWQQILSMLEKYITKAHRSIFFHFFITFLFQLGLKNGLHQRTQRCRFHLVKFCEKFRL